MPMSWTNPADRRTPTEVSRSIIEPSRPLFFCHRGLCSGMSGKITVATFSDLPKAEVAKKQLEQAGIPAQLTDESKLQRFWFLSRPLAGKKIKVAIEDFDRGRAVLEKADATDHILRGEIRCPQCGS